MSAIGGPDEHFQTEQPETSQQYNPAESGSEYDENYEPEREFVLMPLFRRIADMLGLRHREEPEYIYEPEPNTPPYDAALHALEPNQQVVLPETAIQYSEPQLPAENQQLVEPASELAEELPPVSQEPAEEDVLHLESAEALPTPEPVLHRPSTEWRDLSAEPIQTDSQEEFVAEPSVHNEERQEQLVAARSEIPVAQPAHSSPEEWPAPVEVPANSPEAPRKRNPEEIRQLVAPLREAATKITAIVAQAADWLRAKEEEFLRSAEVTPATMKPEQDTSAWSLDSRAQEQTGSVFQHRQAPIVQQEPAASQRIEREPQPVPIQFIAKPDRPMAAPTVPFWKRIQWAEEFTPKRVAFLGGMAMAMLLVLGISLARRPASSVLPEQQTRSIEPGGVTVTTHPVAAPVAPPVLRNTSATARPSPLQQPHHRSRRTSAAAAAYDEEPEVVIHHYDTARKPSPVKQTTVAGVRHYSDM